MNIGIIIGRIGGIDGVALETEKWITVLRRLGHRVSVLTGAIEGDIAGVADISVDPRLAFDHPAEVAFQQEVFPAAFGRALPDDPTATEAALVDRLRKQARDIAEGIRAFVRDQSIDALLPENALALPCHLSMGLGIAQVLREDALLAVTHDHDFVWERGARYATPYPAIQALIEETFPLVLPHVKHAVINRAAQATLKSRFAIADPTVVPNVMDFDAPFATRDAYNADLREALGLASDDLLLVQITRIVERKGIHTAIDLVARLADPRVKLLITGTAVDDVEGYLPRLRHQVEDLGLGCQVLFAGDRFDNQRKRKEDGAKIYALADAYAHADAMTYFSTYEGFGNAFVEAVCAKVPILVNNYKPVYWPDIGSLGFDTVMIEDGHLSDAAVAKARDLLRDPERRQRSVDHNHALGREHFSYEALERLLEPLFGRA